MTAARIAKAALGFIAGAVAAGWAMVGACATAGVACGWMELVLLPGNGL